MTTSGVSWCSSLHSTSSLCSYAAVLIVLLDWLAVEYLPKGSPYYNAVDECWRQGKDDLLVSKYYPKFPNLKCAIANY